MPDIEKLSNHYVVKLGDGEWMCPGVKGHSRAGGPVSLGGGRVVEYSFSVWGDSKPIKDLCTQQLSVQSTFPLLLEVWDRDTEPHGLLQLRYKSFAGFTVNARKAVKKPSIL